MNKSQIRIYVGNTCALSTKRPNYWLWYSDIAKHIYYATLALT